MSYQPKGMHAASEGLPSAVRDKGHTVRTILRRGRPQRARMLDAWDMTGPTRAVVMPGKPDELSVRISRKLRVSPLTIIAQKLKRTARPHGAGVGQPRTGA